MKSTLKTLLQFSILLVVGGAAVWVLSIDGIVTALWSSIFGAIFTVLGVIGTLLQLYFQLPDELLQPTSPSSPIRQPLLQGPEAPFYIHGRKGVLIVKARKKMRGTSVHLHHGFKLFDLKPSVAANIVERKLDGSTAFVALFPSLEPGNYTVFVDQHQRGTKITVCAGQVAEIDWRDSDLGVE